MQKQNEKGIFRFDEDEKGIGYFDNEISPEDQNLEWVDSFQDYILENSKKNTNHESKNVLYGIVQEKKIFNVTDKQPAQILSGDDQFLDESYLDIFLRKSEEYENYEDDSRDTSIIVTDISNIQNKGFPDVLVSSVDVETRYFGGILEHKLRSYDEDVFEDLDDLTRASSSRLFDIKNKLID